MGDPAKHPAEAQRVLARLLRRPAIPLMTHVRDVLPDDPVQQGLVFDATKQIVESGLDAKLRAGSGNDPSPTLTDRMTFCWLLLRNAEQAIKKQGAKDIPRLLDFGYLRGVFCLLPNTVFDDEVIQEICVALAIDPQGGFLPWYNEFLRAVKPKKLGLPIIDRDRGPQTRNIRRIIRWIIRRRREQYVDANRGDTVQINLPYLLDVTLDELEAWCGTGAKSIPGINEEAENEINHWLEYSCLEGPDAPSDEEVRLELARSFVKANKLKDRVYIPERSRNAADDSRIRELEQEIARYAEENRSLEGVVATLKGQAEQATTRTPHQPARIAPETTTLESSSQALRHVQDLVKLLDAKYSLEILHAIQLGEASSLTLKNFLGHLFYVLRKSGLCPYPQIVEFDLKYDESGLYDCAGFEVPPGKTCRVILNKPGWAIRDRDRFLPIRKAQVRLAD